jgi:hypothetical protein
MPSPPRSPTTLNTPRNRALDIGTDKGGFPADAVPMDHAAGVPSSVAGGTPRDNVSGSPFTNAPEGAADCPSPIK